MYEKKVSVVYRGVERYNWFSLRRIAKYGNDRNTADGRKIFPQSPTKKSPNEAIWATTFEGKAWEYSVRELRNKYIAHPEKAKGKALLLLYNEKQLVQTGDYGFEWEIREGLSFRDALLAIVIVEFV